MFALQDLEADPEEKRKAVLEVALDLVTQAHGSGAPGRPVKPRAGRGPGRSQPGGQTLTPWRAGRPPAPRPSRSSASYGSRSAGAGRSCCRCCRRGRSAGRCHDLADVHVDPREVRVLRVRAVVVLDDDGVAVRRAVTGAVAARLDDGAAVHGPTGVPDGTTKSWPLWLCDHMLPARPKAAASAYLATGSPRTGFGGLLARPRRPSRRRAGRPSRPRRTSRRRRAPSEVAPCAHGRSRRRGPARADVCECGINDG